MLYSKSPTTVKQQIEILKERGCIINDRDYAEKCLTDINYYRLAYYFAPFRREKGMYKEGTTFEAVMNVYNFDRMLRRLIMTYLEEIEVSFRAWVSNFHAMKYGSLGYLNPSGFDISHNHPSFVAKIERLIENNGKEAFVIHHRTKYGGIMPVWAVMELFSFGMLSCFYSDLKTQDKKEISQRHYDINYRAVENRLMCLSDLRNACAHYTRLYENPFSIIPRDSGDYSFKPDAALRSYLIAARSLYPDKVKWDYEFIPALYSLIEEYSMEDKMLGYGFESLDEGVLCR